MHSPKTDTKHLLSSTVSSQPKSTSPLLIYMCDFISALGPSVATSVFAISIELLCLLWLFRYLQSATGLQRQAKLAKDFRVKRITALLLFDFISLVTNSIKSISISSFIPFSVAALVVLSKDSFNDSQPIAYI